MDSPFGPCVRLRYVRRPNQEFAEFLVDVKDNQSTTGWRTLETIPDKEAFSQIKAVEEARSVRRRLLEGERV